MGIEKGQLDSCTTVRFLLADSKNYFIVVGQTNLICYYIYLNKQKNKKGTCGNTFKISTVFVVQMSALGQIVNICVKQKYVSCQGLAVNIY